MEHELQKRLTATEVDFPDIPTSDDNRTRSLPQCFQRGLWFIAVNVEGLRETLMRERGPTTVENVWNTDDLQAQKEPLAMALIVESVSDG